MSKLSQILRVVFWSKFLLGEYGFITSEPYIDDFVVFNS